MSQHLPKSYRYDDLLFPKVIFGPVAFGFQQTGRTVFGQSMVIETQTPLYTGDLISYENVIYIIPPLPKGAIDFYDGLSSVTWTVRAGMTTPDKVTAMLIEREKWFELNLEPDRMKRTFVPKTLGIEHATNPN